MNSLVIYKTLKVKQIINEIDFKCTNFTNDTRNIKENSVYIGIKGNNVDGNTLYMDAFEKGAKLAILENVTIDGETVSYLKDNNKSIIIVDNTIEALGLIAKERRKEYKKPVIAITGSAGKTSTKDMIFSVLNEKYNVQKTIGNHNNHLGLPLTILDLKDESDMLVVEMGMNHFNEISYLTNIAKPSVAVITNVGTAHIGNLGSRENILKAKLEILEGLDKDGLLIINNDNDLLHEWYLNNLDNYNIKTFGMTNKSDYMATDIKTTEYESSFKCNDIEYVIPVGGEVFIYNALAAIAVGTYYNVDTEKMKKGIKDFELSSNRMNIINNNDITIIDDCYNANFDSLKYAIKYLGSIPTRRIAVIGTMLELGDYSEELHSNVGNIIVDENIDILITVGEYTNFINEKAESLGMSKDNSYHYDNNEDAIKKLKEILTKEDTVLIKASYSMNFKEIVDSLTK